MPSQKAWLEIASDNHSRIFTTLLPHTAFLLILERDRFPIQRYVHAGGVHVVPSDQPAPASQGLQSGYPDRRAGSNL